MGNPTGKNTSSFKEQYRLLGFAPVQSGSNLPTFRKMPTVSVSRVGKCLPDYMESHPRRQQVLSTVDLPPLMVQLSTFAAQLSLFGPIV
jgi:hypothetical protein